MNFWSKFWFSILAVALIGEAIALRSHGGVGTMSVWVWSKISTPGMRAAVGALLCWLIWHFLWAGRGRLTRYDLAAVLLGAALGLAASRWGWR